MNRRADGLGGTSEQACRRVATRHVTRARLPGTRDLRPVGRTRAERTLRPGIACDAIPAREPFEEESRMSRTKRWSPLAVIGAVAIVFSACGGAASPTPSPSDGAGDASDDAASQPASAAPYAGMAYPATRRRPVRHRAVHRRVQEDHGARRQDGRVPAVRAGCRVPAEGRVQRLRDPGQRLSRQARRGQARTSTQPNGTGPTSSRPGTRATGSSSRPTPTTGARRP